ncbi:protein transport protein SEC16B homolog isoform X2 [Mangifera indica]|uniref:protein transport protein SEC16B homolog isoform X2 n=1 Tax=Mangifera indica TaxID=29780 RepID=UPI001CFBBEC2|nr:protein transport protein SEC16B homolog isoform X2 [Mangifera indica]
MASNPPQFPAEDQTDEDFFDKLVDEEDFGRPTHIATTSASSAHKLSESNDSDFDEAKAFANLSLDDSGIDTKCRVVSESIAKTESESEAGSIIKLNNDSDNKDGTEMGDVSDSSATKNGGSVVKEVGWSAFNADSKQRNGNLGFGSDSDFFSAWEDNSREFSARVDESVNLNANRFVSGNEVYKAAGFIDNSVNYDSHALSQQSQVNGAQEMVNGHGMNSSEYWENLYPGWKYDMNTGQWYEVDMTASIQGGYNATSGSDWNVVSEKSEVSYLKQSSQSVVETLPETSTTESVSNWNSQVSQGDNNGYPEHMVFDPQYPGWYYDTIVREWHTLESYDSARQSTVQALDQQSRNGVASTGTYLDNSNSIYSEFGQADTFGSQVDGSQIQGGMQFDNYGLQGLGNLDQQGSWDHTYGNYNQQGLNMFQSETVTKTTDASNFSQHQQVDTFYGSKAPMNNHVDQLKSFNKMGTDASYDKASHVSAEANGVVGFKSFVPSDNFSHQLNQPYVKQNKLMQFSNNYYGLQKAVNAPQQSFQSGYQNSYAPNLGRSSAGRPSHALVTFGFGGKLIVMKDNSSLHSSTYGSQDNVGGSISVLNLMEVASGNASDSNTGAVAYFRALCQQAFPGPLVGGNVGSKELNKWIDERIAKCESPDMDYRKGEVLKLLLSLLKIGCQHYGKLRSPYGTDTALRESDAPESAVAKLFASVKRNDTQFGALSQYVQNLPPEGQIQATALEVQNLLVSGRIKEALLRAQEGQLWGPALILASQLGDQFYVDTVKQMALCQLVAGSPLRTLCLLIAGQPADVFTSDVSANSGLPGAFNISQQPAQSGANGMLDDWEENLAVITANRTKDDELVIIHLGDCLWKDRSEITAAHICYLVAEANFESYSDSARLCLIGADHWKCPRTYASPEAIQRTELYEYSKVLGNSQFILLPFQPYKLIYANMLAEVGKVSESLKYCQTLLKSLKMGRAPEVETWKQLVLSLEERIRTHQQGGYTANLAPTKLVGKLLNFFDSTAHRVVGSLPPPAPSTSPGNGQSVENYNQPMGQRVSQSTMAMPSLMPSASMEPISEWAADGNKMTMSNRSVSEPDFGRTPRQDHGDSSMEATSSSAPGKSSGSGRASRFSRFGFGSGLLQKTMGLVLGPRSDKQAKLGEKNKFYYDEKLKRWVEEGAEPPAEEAALPPPPTTASFQNGISDYNLQSALKSEGGFPSNVSPSIRTPSPSEHSSGIPPIPTNTNQFSAHGRSGVRSRYVDTFNQGTASPAKFFQSPSVPSVKPAVASNAKFFVPAPVTSAEQPMEAIAENVQEETANFEKPSTSTMNDPSQPNTSSITKQGFPMDVMTNGNTSLPPQTRRTASWSGSFSDSFNPHMPQSNGQGEVVSMPPSSSMPGPMNGGSFGDDLHEVEL